MDKIVSMTPPVSFAKKKTVMGAVLLAVVFILVLFQLLGNLGAHMQMLTVSVKKPATYEFELYNKLLRANVQDGWVNYATLKESNELNAAALELQQISVEKFSNALEKLTFWINAHNLLVLKIIADKYPVQRVQDLGPVFGLKKFVVGAKLYSVGDIEQEEIHPLLTRQSCKAVFLLNNGALGYPPLLNHAIAPNSLTADMEEAARRFVSNPQNVQYASNTRTLSISRFFKWNEKFLRKQYATPFTLVNDYLPEKEKIDFQDPDVKFAYLPGFVWYLNDLALREQLESKH